MSRAKRVGVVLAGYVLALVAGAVSSHLYNVRVSALPYDTSGGMYAAGDMLAWLGFFLPIAGAMTLLALWFLREQRLWKVAAIAAVAFASVGLLAVLAPLTHRGHAAPAPLMLLELVGVVQMLGVPLWLAGCTLLMFFAPAPDSQRLLRAAVALELVIAVCAAVHWFMPFPPF